MTSFAAPSGAPSSHVANSAASSVGLLVVGGRDHDDGTVGGQRSRVGVEGRDGRLAAQRGDVVGELLGQAAAGPVVAAVQEQDPGAGPHPCGQRVRCGRPLLDGRVAGQGRVLAVGGGARDEREGEALGLERQRLLDREVVVGVVDEPVTVHQEGEQHRRLVERELPPDAGAFTGAERLEGVR